MWVIVVGLSVIAVICGIFVICVRALHLYDAETRPPRTYTTEEQQHEEDWL